MNGFLKNLGIIIIVLAAIVLVLSHFLGWNNINAVQFGSLGAMIALLLCSSQLLHRAGMESLCRLQACGRMLQSCRKLLRLSPMKMSLKGIKKQWGQAGS